MFKKAELTRANFEESFLAYTDYKGATFKESLSLEKAILYGTVFEDAIIENGNVSFKDATLDYVHFAGVQGLSWARLGEAKAIRFLDVDAKTLKANHFSAKDLAELKYTMVKGYKEKFQELLHKIKTEPSEKGTMEAFYKPDFFFVRCH